MKKYFIFALIIGALIMPRLSLAATPAEIQAQINAIMAQIKQLQAQLAELQGQTSGWCHDFSTNLRMENSGTEVAALKTALRKENFDPKDESRNEYEEWFGESTAAAVSGFQQKYADEILTPLGFKYGTGYVGKTTRAKLNKLYGCGIVPTPTPVPTPVCNVSITCVSGYAVYDTGEKDSNGCPIKRCIPPTQNQPPVISGVSGPTTLKVNETGTWTIKASDPEQGVLIYQVFWGDEAVGASAQLSMPLTYTQTATFTHSYAWAGVYNPTFQVTDNQGLLAKTSISVNVGETTITPTPSITVLSPNGGEGWTAGTVQTIKWNNNLVSIPEQSITFDIFLASYCAPGRVCIALAPYTIAKAVSGLTYNWNVGSVVGGSAPAGSYLVKVCQSGTTNCDQGDAPFSILAAPTACTDSDNGKNYYVKGTVTKDNVSKTDECAYCTGLLLSPVTCGAVKEYYCEGNEIKSETFVCPGGYSCKDGACVST